MKALSEPKPQAPIRKVMKPANVTKRKKLRRQPIRPAIGSLYDIMHDHAGISLFTYPVYWTALHTKLLNCRFVQLPPHLTPIPTPPSSQRPRKVSQTIISIGRHLDTLMATDKPITAGNTSQKNEAMATVLSTLYPEHLSDAFRQRLGMRFGSRYHLGAGGTRLLWRRMPDANPMSSYDSSTTKTISQPASPEASQSTALADMATRSPPILAYVSRRHTNYPRVNCLSNSMRSKGKPNEPVLRLQALRAKLLTPKNADEDPHYLGLMVAMAQQYVYTNLKAATNFKPRDVEVRVLAVAEEDNAFVVYTGIVPAALLSMFHEPDTAPTSNSEVIISHARVPVWPVLGLKERLGKALGPDLVGHFDDDTIDTFHETVIRAPQASSKKREREQEREVLSEVFNDTRPWDLRTFNEHWGNLPDPRDLPDPPRPKKRRVGDIR
ncbi:hypothetical protein F4680DRAFT_401689 [Xylaria scruposa]|nr:hypothetical protein F4680DRAFT_401689 [Xylaria scruposa]